MLSHRFSFIKANQCNRHSDYVCAHTAVWHSSLPHVLDMYTYLRLIFCLSHWPQELAQMASWISYFMCWDTSQPTATPSGRRHRRGHTFTKPPAARKEFAISSLCRVALVTAGSVHAVLSMGAAMVLWKGSERQVPPAGLRVLICFVVFLGGICPELTSVANLPLFFCFLLKALYMVVFSSCPSSSSTWVTATARHLTDGWCGSAPGNWTQAAQAVSVPNFTTGPPGPALWVFHFNPWWSEALRSLHLHFTHCWGTRTGAGGSCDPLWFSLRHLWTVIVMTIIIVIGITLKVKSLLNSGPWVHRTRLALPWIMGETWASC